MNREQYKTHRKSPKRDSTVSKAKIQMLAKPKPSNSTATPKLREIYNTKTEWATKLLPKVKEA